LAFALAIVEVHDAGTLQNDANDRSFPVGVESTWVLGIRSKEIENPLRGERKMPAFLGDDQKASFIDEAAEVN
jgi:hypothetical protein